MDEPIVPAGDPTPPAGDPTPPSSVLDGGGVPLDPNAPVNQPAPAPDPTGNFHTVIGPDGRLLEGWKNELPEDIRNEASLDIVTDVPSMAKQLVNAQKMVGRDKITIPGDNAQPEEIDAFQIKLGRPVTKDEYVVNIPEGMEDRFDVDESKDAAFQFGFSQKQLDQIMVFRAQEVAADDAAEAAADELEFKEAERIVMAQCGDALEEQKQAANSLITMFVPEKTPMPDGTEISAEQYQEKLLNALNDNPLRPYVFNLLANIWNQSFSQHNGIPVSGDARPGAMTPGMLQAKADELMATPGYSDGALKNSSPDQYKRLTTQITDIYNRIERATKAAG